MKISHLVWCSLLAVSSLAAQNLQVAPMVQPPSGTIQVVPQVKKPEAKALQAQAPLVTKITVEAEAVKAKVAPSVQPVVKNRQNLKPFAVAPNGQGKGLQLAPAAPQAMQPVKVQPGLMPSALLPGTAATKSMKAGEADEVPSLVYLDEGFTVTPLPANPGSPLEIKATIKNTGSNAYTGWLYAALVTLDGEGNITDIPYTSSHGTAVDLPAGQQQELTFTGTLGAEVLPGNEYYLMFTDINYLFPSEQGSVYGIPVNYNIEMLTAWSDLPDKVTQYADGMLNVEIKNNMAGWMEGDLYLFLCPAGTMTAQYYSSTTPSIMAGMNSTVGIPYNVWDLPAGSYDLYIGYMGQGGWYYLTAPDGAAYKTITVEEGTAPQLALLEGQCTLSDLCAGEAYEYKAVLKNNGGSPITSDFTAELLVLQEGQLYIFDGGRLGTEYAVAINPDETATLTFSGTLSPNVQPGQYLLAITWAVNQIVPGEDETGTDDTRDGFIDVLLTYPHLSVAGDYKPSDMAQGENTPLFPTVLNSGKGNFKSPIYFYLTPAGQEGGEPAYITGANADIAAGASSYVYIRYETATVEPGLYDVHYAYAIQNQLFDLAWPDGVESVQTRVTGIDALAFDPAEVVVSPLYPGEQATVTVTFTNSGDDYAGEVKPWLFKVNADGEQGPCLDLEAKECNVPKGGEQQVTFTGTLDNYMVGTYYLGFQKANGDYAVYAEGTGNLIPVTVTRKVTIDAEKLNLPDNLTQYRDDTLNLSMQNSGEEFMDDVYLYLTEDTDNGSIVYYTNTGYGYTFGKTYPVELTIPYNIWDLTPGNYRLKLGWMRDNVLYHITLPDGSAYHPVTVTGAEAPALAIQSESIQRPDIYSGVPFDLQVTFTNTGGNFESNVTPVLGHTEAGDGGNIFVIDERLDATSFALAKGETKQVDFQDLVSYSYFSTPGFYYLAFLMPGDRLVSDAQGQVATLLVSVRYLARVVEDENPLPATLKQYEDGTLTVDLTNESNSYIGTEVCLYLTDPASGQIAYNSSNYRQAVSISPYETTQVVFLYNVWDLPAGTYNLSIGYRSAEGYLWPFLLKDDAESRTVTVEAAAGPHLTFSRSDLNTGKLYPGQECSISVRFANSGSPFEGEITAKLGREAGNNTLTSVAELGRQTVTLGTDEAKVYTFAGYLETLEPGGYYLYFQLPGGQFMDEATEGNVFDVTLEWPLTVMDAGTIVPAQITLGEDGTLPVAIYNASYNSFYDVNLSMELAEAGTTQVVYTASAVVDLYYEATAFQDIPYRVEGIPAGTYDLYITYPTWDGGTMQIMWEDGSDHHTVTVAEGAPTSLSPAETQWMLYPNPATDQVNLLDGTGINRVRLYSLTGTLLLDEAADGTPAHRLDLGRLPQGTYLLQAETPAGIRTERIVKQ